MLKQSCIHQQITLDILKMIYVLEATLESKRMFKIGFTRGNPKIRMKQIQACCPVKLKLIKTFKGGLEEEKFLHGWLRNLRAHGEWFYHGDGIDRLLNGDSIDRIYPTWRSITWAY